MQRIAALLLVFSIGLLAESLKPSDVKIAGDIDYGQTSPAIDYTNDPAYRALVFNGNSGDQIQVTVKDNGHKAWVAIADGSLKELATGTTELTFTLPNAGPDLQAYYIVFRDSGNQRAAFTVELKKLSASPK